MRDLENVRPLIETLLAAIEGEAALSEGVTLKLGATLTATLTRSEVATRNAVLAFDPPPEIRVRRGPMHLRCRLESITVGPTEIHAAIDGWFDRRWPVTS